MFWSIMQIGPTPSRLKHDQTITEPPPCITVGTWYLTSFRRPIGRQTYLIPSEPNILKFDSPLHSIFDHWFAIQFGCSLASFNHALQFFAETKGFLTGRRPKRLFCLKRHFIVA